MPPLLESYEIRHPMVSEDLEGAVILHLTDFHIRAPWRRHPQLVSMLGIAESEPVDLVCLTGDYVERLGFEHEAIDLLSRLANAAAPRFGVVGIFGNHDPPELIEKAREIRGIRWLENRSVTLDSLVITGVSEPEDMIEAVLSSTNDRPKPAASHRDAREPGSKRRFHLGLAHYPTNLVPAAAMGIDLLLAGHTHGGQIRLSASFAPHTSCDLTSSTASGMLRLDQTLCCISRGLGQTVLPFRFRCPPQVGLYRLTRGPLLGEAQGISRVLAW